MTEYRHPRALDDVAGHPPASVTLGGETVSVARDSDPATFESDTAGAVRALARSYGVGMDTLRVGEGDSDDASAATCDVVKSDGEVCGRDLPCQYHSEDS